MALPANRLKVSSILTAVCVHGKLDCLLDKKPSDIDQYIKNGHYFFHDIQIRAMQLRGTFKINSRIGKGTSLEIEIPLKQKTNTETEMFIPQQGSKVS